METTSTHIKPACAFNSEKCVSKLAWSLRRDSTEDDEAVGRHRAKMAIRKYVRREKKRTQLAKLSKILRDMNKKDNVCAQRDGEAFCPRRPSGAMAPGNSTQYLMSVVYEDMKADDVEAAPVFHEASACLYGESLSPRSVYTALDSCYDSCLAFQQRDFEEAFGQCW